jgi:phosphoribosylamine--glycine ligase
MRILFITLDFSGASLCRRLTQEGHEVKAIVTNPSYSKILDGVLEKIVCVGAGTELPPAFNEALIWMGHDGLIICDDSDFGSLQDRLRNEGYSVVGGSAGGDLLEDDREHAQRIFAQHGLRSIPTHTFNSAAEAADFVEKHGGEWVVKRNGRADKTSCYVGSLSDGRDVVGLLRNDARRDGGQTIRYVLQKRIQGVEIGVGRYFNGTDWIGPIELNIEHKKLFPGDLGPKTCEMGTLLWYTANENNRLFCEILAPLKSYLREINFRGDFDINCIVNTDGAWPLEATTRFGYPAIQAQMALHETPWGEFLKAVADGKYCDLRWHSGYAVVALVATPPFPFCTQGCDCSLSPHGLPIHFRTPFNEEDQRYIHYEDVAFQHNAAGQIIPVIAGDTGYILHVSGHGNMVESARATVNRRIENIVIPRSYHRTDIGAKFANQDQQRLKNWGYL